MADLSPSTSPERPQSRSRSSSLNVERISADSHTGSFSSESTGITIPIPSPADPESSKTLNDAEATPSSTHSKALVVTRHSRHDSINSIHHIMKFRPGLFLISLLYGMFGATVSVLVVLMRKNNKQSSTRANLSSDSPKHSQSTSFTPIPTLITTSSTPVSTSTALLPKKPSRRPYSTHGPPGYSSTLKLSTLSEDEAGEDLETENESELATLSDVGVGPSTSSPGQSLAGGSQRKRRFLAGLGRSKKVVFKEEPVVTADEFGVLNKGKGKGREILEAQESSSRRRYKVPMKPKQLPPLNTNLLNPDPTPSVSRSSSPANSTKGFSSPRFFKRKTPSRSASTPAHRLGNASVESLVGSSQSSIRSIDTRPAPRRQLTDYLTISPQPAVTPHSTPSPSSPSGFPHSETDGDDMPNTPSSLDPSVSDHGHTSTALHPQEKATRFSKLKSSKLFPKRFGAKSPPVSPACSPKFSPKMVLSSSDNLLASPSSYRLNSPSMEQLGHHAVLPSLSLPHAIRSTASLASTIEPSPNRATSQPTHIAPLYMSGKGNLHLDDS